MEVLPCIIAIYLSICLLFSKELFAKKATLAIVAFSCTACDIFVQSYIFTIAFLAIYTLFVVLTSHPSMSEFTLFAIALAACTYWLGMDEFKDGYALSHLTVAIGIGIFSLLAFNSHNRQALSLICLNLAFMLTYRHGIALRPYELISAFFVLTAITQNYTLALTHKNLQLLSETPLSKRHIVKREALLSIK